VPSDGDELVLSHAAKRKEKKRQRMQADGSTTTEASSAKKTKSKHEGAADQTDSNARSKRQNSVWVGNLPFKATPDAIKRVFHEIGEITRIHMPTRLLASGAEGGAIRKENRGSVTIFRAIDFFC
jgi:RNA recognition motif-containing protein